MIHRIEREVDKIIGKALGPPRQQESQAVARRVGWHERHSWHFRRCAGPPVICCSCSAFVSFFGKSNGTVYLLGSLLACIIVPAASKWRGLWGRKLGSASHQDQHQWSRVFGCCLAEFSWNFRKPRNLKCSCHMRITGGFWINHKTWPQMKQLSSRTCQPSGAVRGATVRDSFL